MKTEQMLDHLEKKEYQQAKEIADGIDWRRVKNASMLNTVSEIYEYNGEFKKGRDILFLAFDRAPGSRKIVYRLGTLALKIKDIREATDCYEEFVKLAPKDPNQYILKYKILRTQGASLTDQITALEEFKKAEYIEKWAYELAKLYDEAGMTAECLEECDDLILWFSEGKYVYLAMELKMKYKPLTPLQQEKYDSRPGAVKKKPEPEKQPESTLEEVDDENEYNESTEETVDVQEEPVREPVTERVDESEVQEIPPQEVPMQETVVQEEIPQEVPMQETVVQEEIPQEEIERVKKTLRDYTERVTSGEIAFSTLARLYSEDEGSRRRGGELGFMGRAELVPEYANVAFNLQDPNKVSKIVESEFGFHIIQLIEKRGDRINTRHILLKPKVDEKDLEAALLRLDSIANDIRNEKFTFDDAATYISHDKDTRNNHGLMANPQTGTARFEMQQLAQVSQEAAKMVEGMNVGEISKPFTMINAKGKEICAIVKLKTRLNGHKATITEDYQRLKGIVMEKRSEEKLDKWIRDKQKHTYVRINEKWQKCDFKYPGWVKK